MRTSNLLKRIVSILVLIAMLTVSYFVLSFALVRTSYGESFIRDLDAIESSGKDIDLLFIGGSRVYRSFVPQIFKDSMGYDVVLNAGSSSQPLVSTYYQLVELAERFEPKNVVIGVSYGTMVDPADLQGRLIVLDRLSGVNRLNYIKAGFSSDEYMNFIPLYRYRSRYTDLTLNIKNKLKSLTNTDFVEVKDQEYYADMGFVYSEKSFEQGNIPMIHYSDAADQQVLDENEKYLDMCISYCKDKGINVYMVTGMSSMMKLYNTDNYQHAVDYFINFASERDVVYHNLCYLKDRELTFTDSEMFDFNHLNGWGGEAVSRIYAEILSKTMAGEDTSEYFYADEAELKSDVQRVVAVNAETAREGTQLSLTLSSLHNESITPLYRIEYSKNDEEYSLLCDWTEEQKLELILPDEDKCYIKVYAKCKGVEDVDCIGDTVLPQTAAAFRVYKIK